MDNPVTFAVLAWIIGVVLAFIASNWVFTYRSDQLLHRRISGHGRRLDDYKLEVAERYASVDHLKEVEGRLIDEIKGLRKDLKELTNAILIHNNQRTD
jgi:uncharacterized membrane-anchored protein YhcB (DUF1043 family)